MDNDFLLIKKRLGISTTYWKQGNFFEAGFFLPHTWNDGAKSD